MPVDRAVGWLAALIGFRVDEADSIVSSVKVVAFAVGVCGRLVANVR